MQQGQVFELKKRAVDGSPALEHLRRQSGVGSTFPAGFRTSVVNRAPLT
jgi:hypothetical protein